MVESFRMMRGKTEEKQPANQPGVTENIHTIFIYPNG